MKNWICLVVFSLWFAFFSPHAESRGTEYILGVVPQYTSVAIYEAWTPFVEYLSKKTGLMIKLKLSKSIPEFERELFEGKFDFVFMNPYHQVVAKGKQGYLPLVHDRSNKLVGILVVSKDSPIISVKELDGATIAFPSPNAFAASLYQRALLSEREGISLTPTYVKTHDNVYRHVVLGRAVAGGGVKGTLKKQPLEVQEHLRILFETPGVTPHPFSVHPRIPEKLRQDIVAAIFELSHTAKGKKMLEAISILEPTAASYDDYKELEILELDRYWVEDAEE